MYEIKVLESKDFDEVSKSDPRYSYVDDTNLGFSDRVKGVAYVRDSKIHDLNKYLINHELEELIDEHSDHEDPNGIRHKKGNFWANLFDPAGTFHQGNMFGIGHNEGKAGIGELIKPYAGAIGTALGGPVGGAIGTGLGAFMPQGKVKNDSGMEQGAMPSMGSLFSQFSLPGSQSSGANVPDTLSPGANITSSLNQGIDGNSMGLTPEQLKMMRSGNYGGRYTF